MNEMKLELSVVKSCQVSKCAYNQNQKCGAKAITIGDGNSPGCDTFFNFSQHSKRSGPSGVGACKVISCKHNRDFECVADSIEVGIVNNKINCMTFR